MLTRKSSKLIRQVIQIWPKAGIADRLLDIYVQDRCYMGYRDEARFMILKYGRRHQQEKAFFVFKVYKKSPCLFYSKLHCWKFNSIHIIYCRKNSWKLLSCCRTANFLAYYLFARTLSIWKKTRKKPFAITIFITFQQCSRLYSPPSERLCLEYLDGEWTWMAIVMFSHAFLLQPPAVAALCSTALLQIKLLFRPNRSGCSFADGLVQYYNPTRVGIFKR